MAMVSMESTEDRAAVKQSLKLRYGYTGMGRQDSVAAFKNDLSSRYAENYVIERPIPRGKDWPKVTAPYSSLGAYSP